MAAHLNRREFLKKMALGAAAVSLPGALTQCGHDHPDGQGCRPAHGIVERIGTGGRHPGGIYQR